MGMQGVGNGKAASGAGGRSTQSGSTALGKTPVAKGNGSSTLGLSSTAVAGKTPVATPRSTPTMKSGDKVASPKGGGGTDQKNGLVAKPAGQGSGTDSKQIVSAKPNTRNGKSYDPRDYLPDPSTVLPGNLGRV